MPLLRFLLGWSQWKSLLLYIRCFLFLMLFGIYQQYNGSPAQIYEKTRFSPLYTSPTEGNLRPSIAHLKHASFCHEILCYFGTSLWQTQLKFQHINQTPPQPVSTHLGTQLLLSQGLLELCSLSLRKSPFVP